MIKIVNLHAREILDSRGYPTIEVDAMLSDGSIGRAAVPSGASVGKDEALELRDGDKSRYFGKGVLNAVRNVNTKIKQALYDCDAYNQQQIDAMMIDLDGSQNKSVLGANAILSVSLAVAKAAAISKKIPLFRHINDLMYTEQQQIKIQQPKLMVNVINGGAHASNKLAIQEFMIVPDQEYTIRDALQQASETFQDLKRLLIKNKYSTNVGDEGGFAPNIQDTYHALDLLLEAIGNRKIKIALDVAASELFTEDGHYDFGSKIFNYHELTSFYCKIVEKYPIISIEDPFAEEDYPAWQLLSKKIPNTQIVGDDLFVTNIKKLQYGINNNIANAILIKLNQIGTLSETIETIKLAKQHNYNTIISHRSGETEDTTISHLMVGSLSSYIKTGSVCRTDRTAKYNELLRIEEIIN